MDKQKENKKDRGKCRDSVNNNVEKSNPKTSKENSKISEIIRTVKKNSSMRLKGSRNSKVMSNKDVSNNNSEVTSRQTNLTECSEVRVGADSDTVCRDTDDPRGNKTVSDTSKATMEQTPGIEVSKNLPLINIKCDQIENEEEGKERSIDEIIDCGEINITKGDSTSNVDKLVESKVIGDDTLMCLPRIAPSDKERNRKLSLDHTILLRGESFSQSEADFNALGKLPLERKSSFFRKKMESFLKNTSEVFRRQSIKRKASMSLQSLPEHCGLKGGTSLPQDVHRASVTSLSSYTVAGSEWSLNSKTQDSLPGDQASVAEDQASFVGSQSSLAAGQLVLEPSDSMQSLNETYQLEAYLNSRAQSVSSGLDTATQGTRRRKATNRANRVTWLASEGLTNYLRRIIKDEEGRKSPSTYQESSSAGSKLDSRGRRLSYQRAVSGEDPVRYLDSLRRPLIPEQPEPTTDITIALSEYTRNTLPVLKGFSVANISDAARQLLQDITSETTFAECFDWNRLSQQEESRQEAIKEFIVTEAEYIRHLDAIVEVFIATAHALQDSGNLIGVDTAKLFSNIPDILNVNLQFWEQCIFPMISDAIENNAPFNTDLMLPAFEKFSDLFHPYEKFVGDHLKALEYLKALCVDADFQLYLSWCHANRSCKRLQLSDIMVKPMQRLTKYSLILQRIIQYTDYEPQRSTLLAMESFTKNYVTDINRGIRQKEEVEKFEKLVAMIDFFEIDFKDEEMDKLFRAHCSPNLKAPMLNCLPKQNRCLIYEGDLRFRDGQETKMDVRAILFTDFLLICKKLGPKSSPLLYKIIRPKYMLNKILHIAHFGKTPKDVTSIVCLVVDELGTGYDAFTLTEPPRNTNPLLLKIWDQKIKEAKLTYELSMTYVWNPTLFLAGETPFGSLSRPSSKQTSEDTNIEREARERVAAMIFGSKGPSTECDISHASITDSTEGSGGRASSRSQHPMYRSSIAGSSHTSRMSSLHHSISGASRDEPGGYTNTYQAGNSVDYLIPAQNPEEGATSITVTVPSESESETVINEDSAPTTAPVSPRTPSPTPSTSRPLNLKSLQNFTYQASASTTNSPSSSKQHTLQVQPLKGAQALVHSLPDLSLEQSPQSTSCLSPESASDKLYKSHQELLNRHRLNAFGRFLIPDDSGASYPPPSPTRYRALLRRSMAFSFTCKNPPLSKMGHIYSTSTLQGDAATPIEGASEVTVQVEDEKGVVNPMLVPTHASLNRPKSLLCIPSTSKDLQADWDVITSVPEPKKKSPGRSSFFSSGGWYKIDG